MAQAVAREARDMRERRDVDRLGSHLVWPVPHVSRSLYEQQAGDANIFPGGSTEEDLKLLYGSWKCSFRFPEQGVAIRWVVLRCGLSNQITKPLSLLVGQRYGVIAGTPRQNKSRPSSDRFTDWLPTEPYEPSFCP